MFMRVLRFLFLLLLPLVSLAASDVVNIYAWTGEVPDSVIRQFENETGIKVNIATYGNNEIMYAKLRASAKSGYDLVMPSSYFVDRMRRQHMLEPLDKSKLPNWRHLNHDFLNPAYDPGAAYSLPYIWGVTGIFLNANRYAANSVTRWSNLWESRFNNQLLLLDDTREAFSMALMSLGYTANDTNPEHIKQAFIKLQALMKNVKVFSSDTVASIIIDEDATIGMAWNGDIFKASLENKSIRFIYPAEGFVIWVDNFAIPKNAPHKDTAYQFLNFILRPDIAKIVALNTHFPITNQSGQQLLPADIRNNPMIYPSKDVLRRGQFQTDVGDDTLSLYEKYWEELKMG